MEIKKDGLLRAGENGEIGTGKTVSETVLTMVSEVLPNRCFQVLDLYWRSSNSGDVW